MVSIPSQSGSLLSGDRRRCVCMIIVSQYPHSRAASCRARLSPARPTLTSCLNTLTVGQPLVGPPASTFIPSETRLNTLTVGQPLVGCQRRSNNVRRRGLNTLTVGQPLVGRHSARERRWTVRLNTLTVGQPLVGHASAEWCFTAQQVSIPSQSGSLLSAGDVDGVHGRSRSQYPHSRAASCRRGHCDYSSRIWSVSIPSQSGSLLSVTYCAGADGWYRLNTLTVGQPLVGAIARLKTGIARSQYPHSRAASCR